MIGGLLLLQAVGTLGLGPIGRQTLPDHGCAAFLWRAGEAAGTHDLIAMVATDPARLRIALDGAPLNLDRVGSQGDEGFGLSTTTRYRSATVGATVELVTATRSDLTDGALVSQATLTVTRDGGDAIVVPLAGLVGCRRASPN